MAAKCSSREIKGGAENVTSNPLSACADPTLNKSVLTRNLACPEILDHNILPSRQQAASVATATPDRKRGKSMSRRSGQAGTVVKKGKMWCGRYYEDVPGQDQRKYLATPAIASAIAPNAPKSSEVAPKSDAA